jgi:hypothetical protein
MSRCGSVLIVALAACMAFVVSGGCGRLHFVGERPAPDALPDTPSDGPPDTAPDVAPPDFMTGCAVMLHMDEDSWIDHGSGSGSGSDLANACLPSAPGLATGGATPVVDPIRGRVGRFGPTSCVTLDDRAELRAQSAVTTSAWVRMTGDPSGSFGIVAKRVRVGGEYNMFVWTDSRVWVDIDTANDRFTGTGAVPTDQWMQLTMVYDGSLLRGERIHVYLDGMLDSVGPESSASITPDGSPLAIGCLPLDGLVQNFIGELDDVAVWTRAFSAADVAAWYNATRR